MKLYVWTIADEETIDAIVGQLKYYDGLSLKEEIDSFNAPWWTNYIRLEGDEIDGMPVEEHPDYEYLCTI